MVFLQPYFDSLLKSLPPSPVDGAQLKEAVSKVLENTKGKRSAESRRSQWELLLRSDILQLAATEGAVLKEDEKNKDDKMKQTYYNELRDKLDLALLFTESEACDQVFPFMVLQDLFETQTVKSCSEIFNWLESREGRLTPGLVPQKGKALVLLRTLNDLLRRLSKMGSTTIFCGRILNFLSGVFPLGERSGVNLRGEYGPAWEGVQAGDRFKTTSAESMKVDEPEISASADDSKMHVDLAPKRSPFEEDERKKEDFYNTFWSLQLPFSKPSIFATKDTFKEFQEAVTTALPVIKEATVKEKAMMGSRSGAHLASAKRKREPEEESNSNEYFFAKFLTSPDLLDLEIADTHFRRQFLFQLLVLLNFLSNFTKVTRPQWSAAKNRSVQLDFTLEDSEAQWVQETTTKVIEELRQTTPNGRVFADTASTIIERERNWVKWKNDHCPTFDQPTWTEEVDGKRVGLFEATEEARRKLREPLPEWKWSWGTEPLTEIWEMGYRDLRDLERSQSPGDVKDFLKKIKQEDAKISMKKQRLERMVKARAAAAANKAAVEAVAAQTPSESKSEQTPIDSPVPTRLAAPARAGAASPLHPSLPPKPGTPSKPPSQEPPKTTSTPTPNPQATPAPAPTPARVSTPVPPPISLPADPEIAKYEENKQRWAWLALRVTRDQYLQHFGKIAGGSIEMLVQEIEKDAEKGTRADEGPAGVAIDDNGPGSPASTSLVIEATDSLRRDAEGDVKMEG